MVHLKGTWGDSLNQTGAISMFLLIFPQDQDVPRDLLGNHANESMVVFVLKQPNQDFARYSWLFSKNIKFF